MGNSFENHFIMMMGLKGSDVRSGEVIRNS